MIGASIMEPGGESGQAANGIGGMWCQVREIAIKPERAWADTFKEGGMDTPIVKKGQVWFLKRQGATCITKAIITDITKHTVEIKDFYEDLHIWKIPYLIQKERYAFGQLDFIELVEEAQ